MSKRGKIPSQLTLLVSGPKGTSLPGMFDKWFAKKRLSGVASFTVPLAEQQASRSGCPVDVMRIRCPAEESSLTEVISGVCSASAAMAPEESHDFWLRAPGTPSIPLPSTQEAGSATARLLEYTEGRSETSRDQESRAKDLAELSVIAYCGESGIDPFRKKCVEGLPPEEAAEDVINSCDPRDQFDDEVSFVF